MQSSNTNVTMRIPEITTEELQTAINKLKKGKSPDSNGIRAEDIKTSDEKNEGKGETNLQRNHDRASSHQKNGKHVKKNDTKKRDVEDVGNYRPIYSLPSLYKLFASILFSRLNPRFDQIQAED